MALHAEIEAELTHAREALADGNDGKARVCARRGVGKAFLLSPRSVGVTSVFSANQVVKLIAVDSNVPASIREAAARLAASVADNDREGSKQPVQDALMIIEYLLNP